ncbi:hypothetical protein MTO96_000136 [Rhipicephalus appendiculatus]
MGANSMSSATVRKYEELQQLYVSSTGICDGKSKTQRMSWRCLRITSFAAFRHGRERVLTPGFTIWNGPCKCPLLEYKKRSHLQPDHNYLAECATCPDVSIPQIPPVPVGRCRSPLVVAMETGVSRRYLRGTSHQRAPPGPHLCRGEVNLLLASLPLFQHRLPLLTTRPRLDSATC